MRDIPADQKRFLDAYEEKFTVEAALRFTGLPRSTFYRWKSEDRDFRKEVDKIKRRVTDKVSDIAESVVIFQINQGSLKAAQFYLTHRNEDYKSVKERRSMELELINKHSALAIPLLGIDTIEY